MMSVVKKFRVFNDCILVKGASRGIVYDLQRGNIKFVENDLCDVFTKNNGKSLGELLQTYGDNNKATLLEYLNFMIRNEFGFWYDDEDSFPLPNRIWESPYRILNGIIDTNERSDHDYKNIFRQYNDLGCQHLELRFFDQYPLPLLKSLLAHLHESRIKSVEIIFKYDKRNTIKDYEQLTENCPRINKLTIHSAPENRLLKEYGETSLADIIMIKQTIDSSSHCGNISPEYFRVNRSLYLESLKHNSCLNRKIAVDTDGEIKNCPSLKESYGNIKDARFKDVILLQKFQKYWSISKDQIDVCKVCEFRYACTDCRAFVETDLAKPKKCNYNPYTMEWEDTKS